MASGPSSPPVRQMSPAVCSCNSSLRTAPSPLFARNFIFVIRRQRFWYPAREETRRGSRKELQILDFRSQIDSDFLDFKSSIFNLKSEISHVTSAPKFALIPAFWAAM